MAPPTPTAGAGAADSDSAAVVAADASWFEFTGVAVLDLPCGGGSFAFLGNASLDIPGLALNGLPCRVHAFCNGDGGARRREGEEGGSVQPVLIADVDIGYLDVAGGFSLAAAHARVLVVDGLLGGIGGRWGIGVHASGVQGSTAGDVNRTDSDFANGASFNFDAAVFVTNIPGLEDDFGVDIVDVAAREATSYDDADSVTDPWWMSQTEVSAEWQKAVQGNVSYSSDGVDLALHGEFNSAACRPIRTYTADSSDANSTDADEDEDPAAFAVLQASLFLSSWRQGLTLVHFFSST